jgi:hypothetical protein
MGLVNLDFHIYCCGRRVINKAKLQKAQTPMNTANTNELKKFGQELITNYGADTLLCELPKFEMDFGCVAFLIKSVGYDEAPRIVIGNCGWWGATVSEFVEAIMASTEQK